MTTDLAKGDAITVRLDISHDMAETLKAYSEKHGISAEQAINYIVQNFLAEDSCMDSEPGPAVILDDDEYDHLEAEFKAGLDSASDEPSFSIRLSEAVSKHVFDPLRRQIRACYVRFCHRIVSNGRSGA